MFNSETDIHAGDSRKEDIYNVEKILDRRIRDGNLQYYLKWEGFTDAYNSWEPFRNLNCPALISAFEEERFLANQDLAETDEAMTSNRPKKQVEKVMGVCIILGQRYYVVKWFGITEPSVVKTDEAHQNFPRLVIEFYESCLHFPENE